MRGPSSDTGLTLIELVAAMAIFALVAVMGAQGLVGMIHMRDGLEARSARVAKLELATSLIRADLNAAIPLLFFPPARAAPQSSAYLTDTGFALSIGGQKRLDLSMPPAQHRAEYRLDSASGTLFRRVWTALTPAQPAARGPEIAILTGVTDLSLRSYWGAEGWRNGLSSTIPLPDAPSFGGDSDGGNAASEVYSSTLPDAIELTLILDGIGSVLLLETLR